MPLHPAEIQHEAVIDGAEAGNAVGAVPDREGQPALPGRVDRDAYVGDSTARTIAKGRRSIMPV